MDELEELDLDRLQALIQVLDDGNVTEFTFKGMTIKRGPAPPEPVSLPTRPTVDSNTPPQPSGYVQLMGGRLPPWPKAE